MAYFRPVQAEGRPTSFGIAADSGSFERGALVFLKSDGTATSNEADGPVLGIADDNYSTTYNTKIVGETILGSGTTTTASVLTVTVYTAQKPIGLDGYAVGTDLFLGEAGDGSLTVEYKKAVDTAWTAITDTTDVEVVVANATTGALTVSFAAGVGLDASTAYNVRLVMNYSYVNTSSLGFTTALDMVGNDTTIASGKVTVYFMPGIYETDQFDPYITYVPGDVAYAVQSSTAGLVTTASTSGKAVGIVLTAPSAALDAANSVVYGHENPVPNSLRILMRIDCPRR